MDELRAYYYSFTPTGQREVDLILYAVARAGKAFHHTSQWADDEMEGFYEHCEGDTCEQWIQNAANKAAAELATLRARVAELERDAARWIDPHSKVRPTKKLRVQQSTESPKW